MAEQRDFPYIWATWLPKLLTGENSCEWAVWFKAHHKGWARQPSDFDQSAWMQAHTSLLNQQIEEREERGHEVSVENQNAFRLVGETAILGGKADLITRHGDRVRVIDVKAGQERPWHAAQMRIYMYAIPRARPEFADARIAGEVVYRDRVSRVPRGSVNRGFIRDMGALIRRLASDEPARRVPSAQECRFCDITSEDCPARIEVDTKRKAVATDDF